MMTIKKMASLTSFASIVLLTACTAGTVKDTANNAITGVTVKAYAECTGEGCEANQIETPVAGATLTGYQTTTNIEGQFFFDPYGETVATEDAMAIGSTDGSNSTYKIQYSQPGYQDLWLDYTSDFQQHEYEGNTYQITSVPVMY